MKILLIIPILFCLQDIPDSTKVQKPIKLFFEQKTVNQRAEDINIKLDSLLIKLQNDTLKLRL